MRFLLKLSFLITIAACLNLAAFAQENGSIKVLSKLPKYERLEGSLTVQGYQPDIGLSGGTATAKLQFQQPDSLRIEVQPNEAAGTRGIIVAAHGDRTQIYDPVSRRLQELPYNIVKQWWRGWSVLYGSPANALFAAFSQQEVAQFYNVMEEENALKLKANDSKSRLQPDYIRIGGSGDGIFYAPFMEKTWNYAPLLNWKFNATGMPIERSEGIGEKVLYETTLSFDEESGLPKNAKVVDFEGRSVAEFTYALKNVSQEFDKSTFDIAKSEDQIPEFTQLEAPSSYSGSDATTLYNKGAAAVLSEENFESAYAAWKQAAQEKSKAVAPWFAQYEVAQVTRDVERMREALDRLKVLLGADNEEVLTREISLAHMQLRWEDADTAAETLVKSQPKNASFLLAQANLQRMQGKTAKQRSALGKILAMEDAPHGVQAAAILSWAQNALTETDKTATDIEDKTLAQQTALHIVNLIRGESTESVENLDKSPSLLTALALMQEAKGQRKQAQSTWEKVIDLFAYPMDETARWHLLALAAQQGDSDAAIKQYQALRETAFTQSDISGMHDRVISAWQKAFGLDALEELLSNRARGMKATEDDAQLWLAFQNEFGSDDDVEDAIKNGVTRFPKSAWWQSQRADFISALVESGVSGTGISTQAALDAANRATSIDPQQPYYQIQKVLLLRSIATKKSAIVDSQKERNQTNAVVAAYQELEKRWKDNSDIELAVAILRVPLDNASQRNLTLESMETALQNAAPLQAPYLGRSGRAQTNNHLRAYTTLQMKAAIARRADNFAALRGYYRQLIRASQSAAEQQNAAVNYLRQAVHLEQEDAVVELLAQLAHEPWEWQDISQGMNAVNGILALNPPNALKIGSILQKSKDPYAQWAGGRLAATLIASLGLTAQNSDDADEAQDQQDSAMRVLVTSLNSLVPATDGEDHILAARAAAALGESALERAGQGEDDAKKAAKTASEWYQKAIKLNPEEMSFSRDLITALHLAEDDAGARSAINASLAKMPLFDPEVMRHIAQSIVQTKPDKAASKRAATIANTALLLAQSSPSTPIVTFWRSGIIAARTFFAAGQQDRAESIYQRLSAPQWLDTDRAIVYLDWQYQLQQAGDEDGVSQVRQQLEELGLNAPQMRSVQWDWQTLD